jgi:hypothetical protein
MLYFGLFLYLLSEARNILVKNLIPTTSCDKVPWALSVLEMVLPLVLWLNFRGWAGLGLRLVGSPKLTELIWEGKHEQGSLISAVKTVMQQCRNQSTELLLLVSTVAWAFCATNSWLVWAKVAATPAPATRALAFFAQRRCAVCTRRSCAGIFCATKTCCMHQEELRWHFFAHG